MELEAAGKSAVVWGAMPIIIIQDMIGDDAADIIAKALQEEQPRRGGRYRQLGLLSRLTAGWMYNRSRHPR